MGLDMYLEKSVKGSLEGEVELAYWRKANEIHNWFSMKLFEDNEEDNCQYKLVSESLLNELKDVIEEVLNDNTKASELLPTTNGFFFGSTDYGQRYFERLEYTYYKIKEILSEFDFEKYDLLYFASY